MRRPGLWVSVLGAIGVGCLGAHSLKGSQPGPYKADFPDLEWLSLNGPQVGRVRLHLECEGQPLATSWPESIRQQFALVATRESDRSVVNAAQAERLPSAWALLQKTSGVFASGPGSAPRWKELHRADGEKIEARELIEYYRAAGLSESLIGAGKVAVEKPLGFALVAALDGNGDGKITDKELALAENLLGKLDAHGDELITPGELLPKISYPGAAGTHWLRAPKADAKESTWSQEFPLIVLPSSRADIGWGQALITRLDRNADGQLDTKEIVFTGDVFARLDLDQDGRLSAAELAGLRDLPPSANWTVALGKTPSVTARPTIDPTLVSPARPGKEPTNDRLEAAFAGMRLAVRADAGTLAPLWQDFRARIESKFREVDSQGTGQVPATPEKGAAMSEWECVLYVADANLDGKVSRAELTHWLNANETYSRSVAMITLLDHGHGLLALLDANQDGALSLRELRLAKSRIESCGAMHQGCLALEKVPGQMRITVGFGPPKRLLFSQAQKGPAWFQAMDRNGDGDLSRKECPFPAAWFDRYDKDHDGLIDFEEAAAVPKAPNAAPAAP